MNEARKPAKVLVVDDEERNRRLLVALLKAEGYSACEAAEGAQALELAREHPPDLVLLDVMMPGMDGYAVARALKSDAVTRTIPIVMVTALDDRDSRLAGLEAGAEDFVAKPVDRNELRIRVRNLLRIKEHGDLLAERAQEMRALVDNLADAVIQIDADGIVRSANPAVRHILGYAPEELIGRELALLMPDAYRSGTVGWLEGHRRTGLSPEAGSGSEMTGRHKDGQRVALEMAVSGYRVGGEMRYLGILRDISERKRVMAELEQARDTAEAASRAKSAFLSTMSHEIRTPMNGVIGTIEVLRQASLRPFQAELVDTIRDSAFSLLSIIDDILDFSKIEAGRLALEREPLSPAQVVESACDVLQPVAARKKVDFSVFTDPALPEWILGDAIRLRQILNNLLSNAIKFSARPDRRGRIRVCAQYEGAGSLRLSVADNGIGIAPELLDKLFTPFMQAEESTTRRYGGTGLGLSICKRLVDMLNGEIRVSSAPGRGSTFTVTLPIEPATEQPVTDRPDLTGLACVIASADQEKAADWRVYLESAGAAVAAAEDARGAVAAVAARPDACRHVVISDTGGEAIDPAGLRAAFAACPAPVGHVLVKRGQRRRPRRVAEDVVSVDGDALRRSVLLDAVAVAAGRAAAHAEGDVDLDAGLPAVVAPPSWEEAQAQGRLILVAEDSEINQKVILWQLAYLGYAAEIAADGRQALALWRTGRHGLLLTDAHMPEMDGYELTAAIRREEGGARHLPIIAFTANALMGEDARCRAAGMDDYLTKPVQLNRLQAMLDKWMPAAKASPARAPSAQDSAVGHAAPVVDVGVLKALVGNDPRVLRELLTDYLASARRLAEELQTASRAGDTGGVVAVAHKLKSSSRSVGALRLGTLCAELERAGRAGEHAAIARPMADLRASLAAVETAIAEALERL